MQRSISLVLSACHYPAGIIDGGVRVGSTIPPNYPGPADQALARLEAILSSTPKPDVWIIAGDQVYVDATAGLFDPTGTAVATSADKIDARLAAFGRTLDLSYQHRDENLWWHQVRGHVPMIGLIDDHEIVDNWQPTLDPDRTRERNAHLEIARRRFRRDGVNALGGAKQTDNQLWSYDASIADHPFFFGDTRTERTARCPKTLLDGTSCRIMSEEQMRAMTEMLLAAQHSWPAGAVRCKFVATPSILLPRRLSTREHPASAMRSDAWDGYPASLYELLAFIANHRIEHCVFLSGDEHLCCVATITLQRIEPKLPEVTLHSIHTGAMYGPYPFANAIREDFAGDDEFEFEHTDFCCGKGRYWCRVRSWFPARAVDGFVLAAVDYGDRRPALNVTFMGADGVGQAWPSG